MSPISLGNYSIHGADTRSTHPLVGNESWDFRHSLRAEVLQAPQDDFLNYPSPISPPVEFLFPQQYQTPAPMVGLLLYWNTERSQLHVA